MKSKRGFIFTIVIIILAFLVGFIFFYRSMSGINLLNKLPEKYCEKQGFDVVYVNETSYCINELNESCDVWEFYRDDCILESPNEQK